MTRLMPALAAVFAIAGLVGTADARQMHEATNTAMNAEVFAQDAVISNQFEIQSSKLALQKSQNDAVKQFAQQMVTDHTALGDKMKTAASQANIKAPNEQLDVKHKNMMNQLQTLNADSFDRQYLRDQLQGHEQAVNLIGNYSRNGGDQPLKQWAAEGLPIIQHHLEMVKDLEKNYNRSAAR